ncbi:S8 family peptidase [Pseudarthrobacter equi]|uniref:S8 family serine peptidase n=1 Tax=Pseudarthrobacter equi TaxID=728066 RepID=UPI0021C0D5D2|nr:S8 family serine peptidase [Pseudarthrobacter equi]MCT9625635.1 S8 family peptidase [Pseudarthrobacter equi]
MFNPRPFAAAALTLVTVLAGAALTALPAQATEPPQPAKPSTAPGLPLRDPSPRSASAQAPTDQFIVGLKSRGNIASEAAVTAQAARSAAGRVGTAAQYMRATATGAQVVKTGKSLQGADTDTFLAALRSSPDVAYAEPDTVVQAAAGAPNDPGYPSQWGLWDEAAGIRVPGAWDISRGEGAVVAVVDSGITYHSDLAANILPGYDMMSNADWARDGDRRDANPQDQGDWSGEGQCEAGAPASRSSWHGTHVAGIIAAVGNNNNGIAGAAPAAKVLPIRAIGPCGGYISDVADSIIWAAGGTVKDVPANPNRAHVVNLSLGGTAACSVTEQNAINFARNAGTAVVVAAGNSGRPAADMSPANCQNVITVAASGPGGSRAPYSNYGSAIDVTAPGGDMDAETWFGIVSTSNFGETVPADEAYELLQGTSMAAPHVSAIAAMLMAKKGSNYTPDMVETRLKATARPLPGSCPQGCGAGLVDATAALGGYNPPAVSPFADVLTGQQFYREMAWLAGQKISTGWDEGSGVRSYRPLQPINRDAMAAFLFRMAGSPAYNAPAVSPFADVSTGQQFYKEMAWLAEQKISTGWDEGNGVRTYRPLQPINRDAMAAFLYRMAGSPPYAAPPASAFRDVSTGQQFYTEMAWLAERGISTGWDEGNGVRSYRPLQPINRDAMAAFLYRLNLLNA